MDVLVISINTDVTVLTIGSESAVDLEKYVEQIADLAREPVRWAVVEASTVGEWGPGDVSQNLAYEPEDLPTATWREAKPE